MARAIRWSYETASSAMRTSSPGTSTRCASYSGVSSTRIGRRDAFGVSQSAGRVSRVSCSVSVPVRIALAEDDQQILFARTVEVASDHMPAATVLTIAGAGHYIFLAPCSFRGRVVMRGLCRDAKKVNRVEVHDRVGRDVTEFFDARLRP